MTRRYCDQELAEAVRSSYSVAQVLKILGRVPTGDNYKVFYRRVTRLGLDTSHFTGQGHLSYS